MVISKTDQVSRLLARAAQFDPDEPLLAPSTHLAHPRYPAPIQEEASPFENLEGLILNLKHVIFTAIKHPTQIDLPARIQKIALAVQDVCKQDMASALAAPYVDANNPYIVVHQMMGAVLTELIAQGKELDQAQRLSLVCAALTRDLGQIPIQSEMDMHKGALPTDLLQRMQQHPQRSVELLERAGVKDKDWLEAVYGHHERLDGSGYASAYVENQISLGAKILAIADTYGAMVKEQAYRTYAHNAQNALKEIYQKRGVQFDGEIARILITKIGLFPPGTLVKLKCGEIAVIKSPTVKIDDANVYSIYGKTGMILAAPIHRETAKLGYEITGLVPYSECRAATVVIKRVWTNKLRHSQ